MLRKIRNATLSALIGLGTLAAMPATAQADGIYFSFGNSGARAGVHLGDKGHSYYRRHHWHHRHHWRGCSPREAVRKAQRYGVRHARVVDVDRSVIRVVGRKDHQRVTIAFSRAPHCPVYRW